MGIGGVFQVMSNRTTLNGLKLGRFRLDIKKKFFTGKMVKHWNKPPKEVVESPTLEICRKHVDVELGDKF